MVVWSSVYFKNIFKINAVRGILQKNSNGLIPKEINYVPARQSGHATVNIREGQFFLKKVKDVIGFHLLLVGVPVCAIIFYIHIFIGPAKLALPPEGYTPKHWEYFEHPISRFLARYVLYNPQEVYERKMHSIFVKQEKYMYKQLEIKVKELIKDRQDYQAWYFQAPQSKYFKIKKEMLDYADFSVRGQDYGMIK